MASTKENWVGESVLFHSNYAKMLYFQQPMALSIHALLFVNHVAHAKLAAHTF